MIGNQGISIVQVVFASSLTLIVLGGAIAVLQFVQREKSYVEHTFDTLNHASEVRIFLSEKASCSLNLNEEFVSPLFVPISSDLKNLNLSVKKIIGGVNFTTLFEMGVPIQQNLFVEEANIGDFQRITLDTDYYFAKLHLKYKGSGSRAFKPRSIPLRVRWSPQGSQYKLTECMAYGFED